MKHRLGPAVMRCAHGLFSPPGACLLALASLQRGVKRRRGGAVSSAAVIMDGLGTQPDDALQFDNGDDDDETAPELTSTAAPHGWNWVVQDLRYSCFSHRAEMFQTSGTDQTTPHHTTPFRKDEALARQGKARRTGQAKPSL